MAEAERPSLKSTAWRGPTWGAERRTAAALSAPARDVASHAVLGLGRDAHGRDMSVAWKGKKTFLPGRVADAGRWGGTRG